MSDSFEFTLHSPLTKEDWNKLSDNELENTISITYQTPQGRQVKYIKCDVLDKIRAEIESYEADCILADDSKECKECDKIVFGSIYRIIDKYRNEVNHETDN